MYVVSVKKEAVLPLCPGTCSLVVGVERRGDPKICIKWDSFQQLKKCTELIEPIRKSD